MKQEHMVELFELAIQVGMITKYRIDEGRHYQPTITWYVDGLCQVGGGGEVAFATAHKWLWQQLRRWEMEHGKNENSL
jgi:hypothetical protein